MRSGNDPASREALCRALTRVVGEHGWSGASPGRVTREAGLAPVALYDHFRSLEHCYVAVYDGMLTRVTRTASRAVAGRSLGLGRDAWEDQLDAIVGAMLSFFSVEPALARTCLVEVLAVGPAGRARRDDALGRFASYLEGLRLTHGEPMPPLAAELIALGTAELMYARAARGQSDDLPELLPDLRRLWRRTVAEHAAPPVALSA